MASESVPAPLMVRFFDGFLQERSIKWVLALGVFLLLGSSLLLVAMHWETATPAWKYIAFLAYSAALYASGEWTYHRLGLRRTGTVLLALTVLMLPILFLVLGQVSDLPFETTSLPTSLLLGTATLGFAVAGSGRVFQHFLRGTQPTFLASYLILAAAGAVLPMLDPAWATPAGLGLWAVFAVGSVKVNRHVFWLTEEQRQPRVLGFFPIVLLGAQFLTLYLLYLAPHVAMEWLGVGCVLVAGPVLATADSVARVFRQRSGDLVRPLPVSVLAPLGIGLVLCAAGVVLAALNVALPHRPHALVCAAAAAGLMALVAHRTDKPAFVWVALLLATVVYQLSPAFFMDLAQTLRDRGASLVREERLPFAFYGLTYLPLLLALMVGGAWRRPVTDLFARPMRHYAAALACLLLALSLTHAKAAFPVGLLLSGVFALQVILFRACRLAPPGLLAFCCAAFALETFLTQVASVPVPADTRVLSLALAAFAMFLPSHWLDSRLAALGARPLDDFPLLRGSSLLLTLGLAGFGLARARLDPFAAGTNGDALVAALVLLHGLAEGASAWRHSSENRVWSAAALLAAGFGYLVCVGLLPLESSAGLFLLLTACVLLWTLRELAVRHAGSEMLARPLGILAYSMPSLVVLLGVYRHLTIATPDWLGANSLALLLAASFCFWRGLELGRRDLVALAGLVLNVALVLLWRDLAWSDPQFFMIPIGLSVLILVQLFRAELPHRLRAPLRYVGALVILVSPTFHIVEGSWLHLFTLMVVSVGVVLLALGLRVRALVYAGTAFLLADLAAMLVVGSLDHANFLWAAGLSLGAGVLAVGAYCERNREALVERMRVLADTLQQWD